MNVHFYRTFLYTHLLLYNLYSIYSSIYQISDMPYLTREAPSPEPIDCRILTAALELYVNRGYHNVSVHDVQKLANVSIGSTYRHFGGKEGIAKALYHHLLNEMN